MVFVIETHSVVCDIQNETPCTLQIILVVKKLLQIPYICIYWKTLTNYTDTHTHTHTHACTYTHIHTHTLTCLILDKKYSWIYTYHKVKVRTLLWCTHCMELNGILRFRDRDQIHLTGLTKWAATDSLFYLNSITFHSCYYTVMCMGSWLRWLG